MTPERKQALATIRALLTTLSDDSLERLAKHAEELRLDETGGDPDRDTTESCASQQGYTQRTEWLIKCGYKVDMARSRPNVCRLYRGLQGVVLTINPCHGIS